MPLIRPALEADWPAIWAVIEPTFRRGDTYSIARDLTEADAHHIWMQTPVATFVACDAQGAVLGTYVLRHNRNGGGAHVSNCGYVVSDAVRRTGTASAMCEHSQQEALRRGFRAMQFNFVVSTNQPAVRLWQKMGFAILCALPGVFKHPSLGYVDAFVMFKQLLTPTGENA